MSWLVTFLNVWAICGLLTAYDCASLNAASKNNGRTCMTATNDIHKAVRHENQRHSEAGLSCCGKEVFNPTAATCCEVEHENRKTANVTQGLSQKVSACCGLKAYDPLNEICCDFAITAKPAPKAGCCGKVGFDEENQLCCGPNKTILPRTSSDDRCCGYDLYNIKTQRCCTVNETLKTQPIHSDCCEEESANVTQGLSQKVSSCCGRKAYDPLNEICCDFAITAKPAPKAGCCGKVGFDEENQLCCGRNKTILPRRSSDYRCCGYGLYNIKTQCCCTVNETLKTQPIHSDCCEEESDVLQQEGNQAPSALNSPSVPKCPVCTSPQTHLCGSLCYDPSKYSCCERNQPELPWCCSGHCDAAPSLYNPHMQLCCDGCVSDGKPWIDQCCGDAPYGLAQRGVLCCNGKLYKDREDGEECSESGIPYNPAKETVCNDQFHGTPGLHCCGTKVYRPDSEICCNGQIHHNSHLTCCGNKAYNIKDPQKKCCAGALYNLTAVGERGHDEKCCGSVLHNSSSVCCSGEGKTVLSSIKAGFRCCGHEYYNSALWSCCAGKLSPVHHPSQHQNKMIAESTLLSLANLNKTDLCKKMYIGTVESVSLDSVVFRNVLYLHGHNGAVKSLASPHIWKIADRCNAPKLIRGTTYFFNDDHVFADFDHHFGHQSHHFIFSNCYQKSSPGAA